jgi:predicted N-formylglutamate amidohydrolase
MGGLLQIGEPEAAFVVNEPGASPVVLLCEHAGRSIPRALGTLGLPESELARHIAWDIGAEGVARRLAKTLDSALVLQRYSRLVYDCNRPPESASAMPAVSELTEIPGNIGLTASDRARRIAEIYEPFHTAAADVIAARPKPMIVTIHSFTPVFKGVRRELDFGVLHDAEARLAGRILDAAAEWPDIVTRRNAPYGPEDGVCHTLNLHTLKRGLEGAMLEIRNDLIASEEGQAAWAERLAALFAAIAGGSPRVAARSA